ncbi:MAG: 3'-5' exonuclease [Cytophagales bacterium]|nr:3'-5' exonuclease [Cytophagales bacterium]
MAKLIPAFGSCRFENRGERRVAERLVDKLDDDYLIWYNVPVGQLQFHPDFIVFHPSRGILILEVKEWSFNGYIQEIDRDTWRVLDASSGGVKSVKNPLEQARHHALQVIDCLKLDPQLRQEGTRWEGNICCSWSYGVVFPNITRKEFDSQRCGQVIQASRVICKDEMVPSVDTEAFQKQLWGMFQFPMRDKLSLPQIDRIRGNLFPELRVASQVNLFTEEGEGHALPEMRVMDILQEQLARSLGEGHRVIHGVAGSGKTMILAYRAEYLAAASRKPVLVLCKSRPLADKLAQIMQQKGLAHKVHVKSFNAWCVSQLRTYGQTVPTQTTTLDAMFADQVDAVIRAVDRRHIPSAQYAAVLIDEGHDFPAHWLRLAVQMIDPETNSLLLLYDKAQSIFQKSKDTKFSFKEVGISARGRTTILKINYRNTRQILATANLVARELLSPQDADEDGVPLIRPMGGGRDGDETMVIQLSNRAQEWQRVSAQLQAAHKKGFAWSDMAIICRYKNGCDEAKDKMQYKHIPCELLDEKSGLDRVRILTMHTSKGLEFPVVSLPNMELMPSPSFDESEEARLFYVAATRATHQLIITSSGDSKFMQHLAASQIT